MFDSITKVFTAYKSRSVTARGKARAASGPLENLTKAFGKVTLTPPPHRMSCRRSALSLATS